MMGSVRRLIARFKQESLCDAQGGIGPGLHDILNDSIIVINLIQSRPLNAPTLWKCGSWAHAAAAAHSSALALSEGEYSAGCWKYNLKYAPFWRSTNPPHATLFQDTEWLAKLCYLADIFSRLKELNMFPTKIIQSSVLTVSLRSQSDFEP